MADFRLTLLGAFALSGVSSAALSKKAQALVAVLALRPGQAHRRDKLASMLWSDRSEVSARQNLRQCLSAIRRAGEAGGALPIVAEGDSLRFDATRITIDVCEFEQALRSREPEQLERALALYRGELLEGLNLQGEPLEEWLTGERRRLRAAAIEGLSKLLAHQLTSGAHDEATQTALRLLTIDPLQEGVHRSLMRLYHETGNTAQALRQYGICEKVLRREVNVEPEVVTKELRRQILRSRSVLPRPTQEGEAGARGDSEPNVASGGTNDQGIALAPDRGPSLPNVAETLLETGVPVIPTDRPSVAVLPFISASDDPRHAALADAICEDVTTNLSGISRLLVIACSSTFAYKGKEIDARRAGQELGVAHVVKGSIRALGNSVRISAQLVNTTNSSVIWADHYDRDIDDVSAIQDQITQEIVTGLEIKLTEGEQIRTWRRDAVSPDAYQHLARGREAYLTFSRSGVAQAREHFERAISINSNFATALAGLGFTYATSARFGWIEKREAGLSNARDAARRALSLDSQCAMAHQLLTYVEIHDRNFEDAIRHGERAVDLHPSDAEAYHVLAMAEIYNGDFAEGVRLEQRSLRLNPLARENALVDLGRAYFHMGRLDDAVPVLQRVCRTRPNWLTARTLLAGCYGETGQSKLANAIATEILRIKPNFSLAWWAKLQLYRRDEDLEYHLASLRGAVPG